MMTEKIKSPFQAFKRQRNREKHLHRHYFESYEHLSWKDISGRISLARQGLPYLTIKDLSEEVSFPLTKVLALLNIPERTYHSKKKTQALLSSKDSELLMLIKEVIDYGKSVFENDDKFHRWLVKTNTSLGGVTPASLFDTSSGIQEIKNALDRINYGNMA